MEMLVWGGAAVSIAGLAGLLWCIVRVWRARRAGLSDADLRTAIRAVLPLNFGALLLSVMGLMMVVAGVLLG